MNTKHSVVGAEQDFKEVLHKCGLKATPQRLAVHKVMLKLGHASADMVVEELAKTNNVTITVASIYNVLSQLAELGIYQYRLSANSKMYFDVNTFKHMHLYDTQNNTYKDLIDNELIELVEDYISKKKFRSYKIDGVDIQILCHPSRAKVVV